MSKFEGSDIAKVEIVNAHSIKFKPLVAFGQIRIGAVAVVYVIFIEVVIFVINEIFGINNAVIFVCQCNVITLISIGHGAVNFAFGRSFKVNLKVPICGVGKSTQNVT